MQDLATRSIDVARLEVSKSLDATKRSKLGQYMTPTAVADFMASLFSHWPISVRLLDPGAGIGSLTEAFAERLIAQAPTGASLEADCFEIEPLLTECLARQLHQIKDRLAANGNSLKGTVNERDFITEASFRLSFGQAGYTHAILNPPYKKINTNSAHRKLLRTAGIETVNLYTAFLGLTVALMEQGGEIVAIIPRSFCNGTYFRPFREFLLDRVAITHIHIFESRKRAFRDDDVLQENIIIHMVRSGPQKSVIVSTSHDPSFGDYEERKFPFSEIVKPDDVHQFIHIPTLEVNGAGGLFLCSLDDLGLQVSTGPVVDFRLKNHWLTRPSGRCAPLLYAHHFKGGRLTWPVTHKRPNALRLNEETRKWLMPRGCYSIIKRFSSKEEKRRVVAYVLEPEHLPYKLYGFENHLNVIHAEKQGIPANLAHGVAVFLNSTVVDQHFRNFSGHTQVNATDLRSMRFPHRSTLTRLGRWARKRPELTQEAIDDYIEAQRGNDQKEAN